MKFPQIKESNSFRIIALVLCLILILYREFSLILTPRLWAEEGSIFLSFAYKSSITDIFTTVHVGYITLFNSIVSFFQAKVFPLELAPIISTAFGLLIQLTPLIIIIYSSYFLWDTIIKKALYLLTIIYITPSELYLNTTNSHFIFGLSCFLIVLISTKEIGFVKKWLYRIILFVGVFTGPASMLLTPIFLFRAYTEKQKEKYIQAAIMLIGSIIQASIIIYSIKYNEFNSNYHRLEIMDFRISIQSFFIDNFSLRVSDFGRHSRINIGTFIFFYSVFLFFKRMKDKDMALIFASFLIVALFSTAGSLRMAGAPRYAYIPSCILYFIIISELFVTKKNISMFRKSIAFLIFLLAIFNNINHYQSGMRGMYSEISPEWNQELAHWKQDNNYKLKIHPQNDLIWDMELKK